MTQYNKYRKKIVSMLLWSWGGTLYFILEVIWKTFNNRTDQISWTMLILAIILSICLERCGAELPWNIPLSLQAMICTAVITSTEFLSGYILNVILKLDIWDYSNMPFNILGQICPQFMFLWYILSLIFIPVFDWIRYIIEGGDKPRYKL